MNGLTSVLSDGTIRRLVHEGRIRIDPWDPEMVQPASVDLRLGSSFRVFHNHRAAAIDLRDPPVNLTERIDMDVDTPFVIHPGEFALGRTEERVALPEDLVARIEGKALALDTEVPTPEGWKTMGELAVGDEVFDHEGRPTVVVAATEVLRDRPCFEVGFSDWTRVVCDGRHQWATRTKYTRRYGLAPRTTTTEDIAASLTQGRKVVEYNHHVDLAGAVEYPERRLPVDPYVLGAWIGDGTSTTAEITTMDQAILDEVEAAGVGVSPASGPLAYRIGGVGHTRDPITGRYTPNASLNSRFRAMGLLGNKHIPREYMEASVSQRRALLEGLMDTDGYVDVYGRCELTTVRRHLAEQYRELVASLGLRPIIATKTATISGRACGLKHDVTFTPSRPVFRLSRKLARQKVEGRFQRSRAIVEVLPVESVPVRCVQVASPRGLFLITRSFIPTHNSSLGRLGLIVHATAGFVDPGFEGTLTLEITNLTRVPIKLWPRLPIAQLSFLALDRPAERPYGHPDLGSHYHGQTEATESRYEGGPGGRTGPP